MSYILFFFLFNTLSHYEGNSPKNIQANNVINVKCFNYVIEDGVAVEDSVLSVERNFNTSGLPLETIIYADYSDSITFRTIYEYQYENDTLLKARNTYSGDSKKLIVQTNFEYDKNDLQIRSESYNVKEQKLEFISSLEYDKEQLLRKIKWIKDNKLIGKESYDYNGHGRLNEVTTKLNHKNNFRVYYTPYGQKSKVYAVRNIKGRKRRGLVAEYQYNESDELTYSKVYSCCKQKIIGVKGIQIISPRDIIEREIEYFENGLIKEEREFINNTLGAIKRYFYKAQ